MRKKPLAPFFRSIDFPSTKALERAHRDIYAEYLGIQDELEDWVEKELYNAAWETFRLFEFPHGEPIPVNISKCPVTAELIDACFPSHGAAGFSRLGPGTEIRPHEGYQGDFLRCHLGLRVPSGNCRLQIGSEVCSWREGEVLIFDDRKEHSAWNKTKEERIVLLIDFVPGNCLPSN